MNNFNFFMRPLSRTHLPSPFAFSVPLCRADRRSAIIGIVALKSNVLRWVKHRQLLWCYKCSGVRMIALYQVVQTNSFASFNSV